MRRVPAGLFVDVWIGLLTLIAVLAAATAFGVAWRSRSGRITDHRQVAPETAALGGLGVDPAGAPVTLVQFSSAFCQPCRATRAVLDQVVTMLPDVRHVEVDAESHLDEVRALRVMRTPTVLIVDRAGRVVRRASGQPRVADVVAAVAPLLARGR